MTDFTQYKKNVKSQNGEDGIIEAIFRRLGITEGHCVEFGAWDGVHLSNTWNLWNNMSWSAVLIEGSKERSAELERNTKSFPRVTCLNAFVSIEGEATLDNLLKKTDTPTDFDLLSVDVDSCDYQIWESLKLYFPKLVVIEHNPTFPAHVDFVGSHNGARFGCSAKALVRLAKVKGYELVCCTLTNSFFLKKEYFDRIGIEKKNLRSAYPTDGVTYAVSSYDGHVYLLNAASKKRGHLPYARSEYIGGAYKQTLAAPELIPEDSWRVLLLCGGPFKFASMIIRFVYKTDRLIKGITSIPSRVIRLWTN